MALMRSTLTVSSMTMASRVLGFLRDLVFARAFGAGPAMDAFFVAFRIPNFMRRLFAEGSFSLAFVPVLAEYREKHDHAALKQLIDSVTGTLAAVLLLVTGIGIYAAPWVISLFAPGFDSSSAQHQLASDMLRLTFPYLFFISLTALAGGILNSFGRFALPALTPVLLNIALIAAALGLAPRMDQPEMALAWGVLAAGALQLLVQIPALARLGVLPRPRWGAAHAGVRRIMRLMLPTLFGSSVAQINLLFDTLVASMLMSGSVTWLYYSDRMMEFPLGMFGVAIGTVILPHLSRKHSADDDAGFSIGLDWALRASLLVAVPASLGLILAGGPIFATMFQYGEFGSRDSQMAALSLAGLSLGLPAFLLVKVLAPAFYSRQNTRTPVKAAVVSLIANVVFTVLLLSLLLSATDLGQQAMASGGGVLVALSNVPGAHACLALASGLAGWLNAIQLWRHLHREGRYRPQPGWTAFLLRLALAGAAMALLILWINGLWTDWSQWAALQRVGHLALLIGGAAITFIGVMLASGFRRRHLG